jgi:hypothetical protein
MKQSKIQADEDKIMFIYISGMSKLQR